MSSIQPTGKSLLELEARQVKADMQKTANEKELAAAKVRYGGNAEQVLGDLDKIKACAETGKQCNVYAGGGYRPLLFFGVALTVTLACRIL